MVYEVKRIEYNDKPFIKDESTLIQHVSIFTGVVGNTYDMTVRDFASVEFPSTGIDAQEIITFIDSKCAEISAEKYPNT